jgi:hypothetical protein
LFRGQLSIEEEAADVFCDIFGDEEEVDEEEGGGSGSDLILLDDAGQQKCPWIGLCWHCPVSSYRKLKLSSYRRKVDHIVQNSTTRFNVAKFVDGH